MKKTTRDIIALSMVPGLGPQGIIKLVSRTADTEQIFRLSPDDICVILGKRFDGARMVASSKGDPVFIEEMRYLEENGIEAVSFVDGDFPELLRNIFDPPSVLFYKGQLDSLAADPVAVVGSRKCSIYGINMADKLSFSMAERGITVVSGLARGIDTAAHRAAIRAGGKTVAVLGSGFRNVYPPEAGPLMDEIVKSGAVVTEFTSSVLPLKHNFPRRNRIISGLSKGVVVAEAGIKSGAMITAALALDEGREVFAVPGRADSSTSGGTNRLIQSGAKLVVNVDDILEEINLAAPDAYPVGRSSAYVSKSLTEAQARVLEIFSGTETSVHIDDIMEKTSFGIAELSACLLKMECAGLIQALAGRNYVLRK